MVATLTKKKVLFLMMIVTIMTCMMTGCGRLQGKTDNNENNKTEAFVEGKETDQDNDEVLINNDTVDSIHNNEDATNNNSSAPSISKETFYKKVSGETVVGFFKDDYDADGREEAFVVTGYDTNDSLYDDVKIYLLDHTGDVTKLKDDIYGYIPQEPVLKVGSSGMKLFTFEKSANGSGSITFIFGVNNGKGYELIESGEHMMVTYNTKEVLRDMYVDESIVNDPEMYAFPFVGFESRFTDEGHVYDPVPLEYRNGELHPYYY